MRVLSACFLLLPLAVATAQNAVPPAETSAPAEALRILNEVSQKYADAKSFHIEAQEEMIWYNDWRRSWEKTVMSSTDAPDGRYRYEGRGGSGGGVIVSDGKTVWMYHPDENLYTETSATDGKAAGPRIVEMQDQAPQRAKYLRRDMAHMTDRLIGAQLLPEETLTINGAQRRCIVIHYGPADVKQDLPSDYQSLAGKEQGTIWIDKERMTVVKKVRSADSFIRDPGSIARFPIHDETTTTFSIVELNVPIPDSTFVFSPPANAKLVDEFPAQKKFRPQLAAEEKANNDMIGKAAPDLELKSEDGKVVRLSSFRGKPVLIDVWATWCGPCVQMMAELKKLSDELSAHGAIFLTVDRDEDAAVAAAFLKRERVDWQNFHDTDGAMPTAFHAMNGVPWQVMIDSDGKVAFYHPGEDLTGLRTAIARLGPQYSSIAPKPEPKKDESGRE